MSATSRCLRRPSQGWTQTSTGVSASAVSATARMRATSSPSTRRSMAPGPRGRGSLTRARTPASAAATAGTAAETASASGLTRVRAICMEPRIWLIAGPTASGKSALAMRLARTIGAEIVHADAIQLYADLRLLSARPSPEEEAKASHRLFGVAVAAEGWSVGRWARAAIQALGQIAAAGRPAVVVGGTGLYFSALTEGLADIPAIPA